MLYKIFFVMFFHYKIPKKEINVTQCNVFHYKNCINIISVSHVPNEPNKPIKFSCFIYLFIKEKTEKTLTLFYILYNLKTSNLF